MADMTSGWSGVRGRLRARSLAGDTRAGSWVRAEAARRELAFVRKRWRPLSALLLTAAGLITGIAFVVPAGFARGLVVGALSASALAMVYVLTVQGSGSTMTRMGATAEQWTASELRPLRRAGWHLINHYTGAREIDHLLIGRAGVIVAETKWSRSAWRRDSSDFALSNAIKQVERSAKLVEGWPEVRAVGCRVRPVVFLWSAEDRPGLKEAADVIFIRGVAVIYGSREATSWRAKVQAADRQLSEAQIATLLSSAVERLADGDEQEAARQPALPSIERVYWTAVGCFVAATAGALVVLEPLSHGSYWWAGAAGVLAVALGLVARRLPVLRLPADAWLAAVLGVGVLAVVVQAVG